MIDRSSDLVRQDGGRGILRVDTIGSGLVEVREEQKGIKEGVGLSNRSGGPREESC